GWSFLALCATVVIGFAARPQNPESAPLRVALVIWMVGLVTAASLRVYGAHQRFGPKTAAVGLLALIAYWAVLGSVHRKALRDANAFAASVAVARDERLLRSAAMP